jgi:phosphoglycerol transferase MdoB-like AlkP superfamily enzyme
LLPLLAFTLLAAVGLSGFRLGLVVWQWPRIQMVHGLAAVFRIGLQMDLQLIAYLLIPPLVLFPLCGRPSLWGRWASRVTQAWLAGAIAFILFMELATPSFLQEYGLRPNRLFIEYLIHPREVAAMLWARYKLPLLVALILVPAAAWASRGLLTRAHRPAPSWTWKQRLALWPLVALVVILGARSSLGHRPANISMAAFSHDPLVNDLAASSAYTVLYAAYRLKDEKDAAQVYGRLPAETIIQVVRRAMDRPAVDFSDTARPTLHYQEASRRMAPPHNLVIILEESLGAQYVQRLGGLPLTPELDRLSREGLWFEQLYATGTRSVRGIEAVVTGFLPTPARSVVKLGNTGSKFFTLARYLKAFGYQSLFVYGGESHFDNMRGFFLNNGFDRVIDEKDYTEVKFKGTWGVSDEDLFDCAHQEFEQMGAQPFFALVFTSSYHSPFEIPAGRLAAEFSNESPEHQAIRYADHALGYFFRQARQAAYWQRTLFLVVADHDDRVRGADLVPIRHFHIPGLIIGPGIPSAVYRDVASQIDLPPTLLSLIGISGRHPMIGRDLSLAAPQGLEGRAIMQYGNNQAYLKGARAVILQPGLPPKEYRYANQRLVPAGGPPDPNLVNEALAHALWPSLAWRQHYHTLP